MFAKLSLLQKFLAYRWKAANAKGHGIHSPFIFDFITKVLNDNNDYDAYHLVEKQRAILKKDRSVLTIHDLGAGSQNHNHSNRRVGSIASSAAKPAKYGQLLFRIARYYNTRHIIELGTSLGITTCYLALSHTNAKVITIEGSEAVAGRANALFQELQIQNVEQVTGNFDIVLPQLLNRPVVPDLVFIDGNHREEPTLKYFEWLLQKKHNDTILVFDDIHWSTGMEKAWEVICSHPEVTTSVDLFYIGIVFFKKEFRAKQHFVIRF